MNMMSRWNANEGLLPATLGGLNDLFRSVFDQVTDFGPEWMSERTGGKMLDLEVGDKEVSITLPLPGCKGDEIEVEMVGDVLTIRAERNEEKKEGDEKHYLRRERSAMSFEESVKLPVRVKGDDAKAKYENGVLTVTLPREEAADDKAHTVKVQ